MRNMSFMLTTKQFREQTKTVTRRLSWWNLKPGAILMGVEKCQGLKKGERIQPLGPIRIINVRHERLDRITQADCIKEGFPHLTPMQFISLFMTTHKGCTPDTTICRIEFAYINPIPATQPTATETGQLYSAGCAL